MCADFLATLCHPHNHGDPNTAVTRGVLKKVTHKRARAHTHKHKDGFGSTHDYALHSLRLWSTGRLRFQRTKYTGLVISKAFPGIGVVCWSPSYNPQFMSKMFPTLGSSVGHRPIIPSLLCLKCSLALGSSVGHRPIIPSLLCLKCSLALGSSAGHRPIISSLLFLKRSLHWGRLLVTVL